MNDKIKCALIGVGWWGTAAHLPALKRHNTIDFAGILKAMQRSRYAGWIGIEYVWIDWEHCNEVDNLSETLLLRDHLGKIAAKLK